MNKVGLKETRILIVDDTPTNIEVLCKTLEPRGYKIQIATNGEIALKILEKVPFPDLILLDVMMPGIDGYETCRRIKMDQSICDIPVIFLTGKNDIKDIIRGFEVGGVDYVTKPFNQEEVYARVKTHVLLKKTLLEKEELIEQLKISSRTDLLTNLLNRRGGMESLEIEAHRFERSKKCFSIVLSDIDHFKNVNDTYGHEAGDKVLVEVGNIIRENCRKHDVACRWGGEEFLILLPETDLEGGRLLAEKIRIGIESHGFLYEEKEIPITMSFGLSMFSGKFKKLDDCVRQADDCLYNAKKTGRNKVVNKIN
jgi:diguanylate cyclase (GGDEF)-like protein